MMRSASLIGGLAALAILIAAPGLVPWDGARALIALCAFFYPAGALARRALFPRFRTDALLCGLTDAALGVGVVCFAVGLAWGVGNRLSSALPILLVLLVALGVLAYRRRREAADGNGSGPAQRIVPLLLLALLLPLAGFRDPLSPAGDSLDHVGSLRKRIEADAVFPRSTFYAVSRENGPDARKGLFHGALALIAQTTGTPPLALWDALPLAASAWTALSVLAAGRRLVPGALGAPLAVLLFVLSVDGGPAGTWLTRFGHPSRMVLAPYWTVWALLLDRADRFAPAHPGRPPLALLALIGFAMAAIHSQAPLQVAASAAFLAGFVALLGTQTVRAALRPLLAGAAAVVLGAAPYLAVRAVVSMPLLDTIHTEPQGLLTWSGRVFLFNPVWLLQGWGVLGPLAVLVALLTIRSARREIHKAFLVSGLLGAAVLVTNPFLTPLLYAVLGYLAIRLVWFTPHLFLFAGIAGDAISRIGRPAGALRPARLLLSIAILLATGGYVAASAPAFARRCRPATSPAPGLRAQHAAFDAVDRAIAAPSVIAADPATGYAVPALTRHWTICAMAQHTSPNDPDARDRLRDARRILSPYVNAADTVALLRQYGAEWVLLNASAQTRLSHYLFHPGPGAYAAARAKVEARADLFARVLDQDGLTLYRVTDHARSGAIADPHFVSRTIDTAPPAGVAPAAGAPADPFLFLGGEVLTRETRRGGSIRIASAWERRAALPEANRFLTVRLERTGSASSLDTTPLAKLSRHLSDRMRGESTRTRVAFVPGDGFLPPDEWPVGSPIRDDSSVTVPASLAPGDYLVKIRMTEEAFYPNLRPSDFVSMKDSYDGVVIGTVRVTEEKHTS